MRIPVIPLRDIVVFPGMAMPLFVKRPMTLAAIAAAREGEVLLLAQRDGTVEQPTATDLYEIGTLARITQQVTLNDDARKLLVQGESRAHASKVIIGDCISAEIDRLPDPDCAPELLTKAARGLAEVFIASSPPAVARLQAVLELSGLDAVARLVRLREAL
jgi:ATP-dependent Lon protease